MTQGKFSFPSYGRARGGAGGRRRRRWKPPSHSTVPGGAAGRGSKVSAAPATRGALASAYDGAVTTLEKYHFSYLHIGYHQQVLSRWKQQNCFNEIDKRLGYRLVLREAGFSKSANAGENYNVVLKMENVGFAAPMNPRDAFLVLSSTDGKVVKTYPVNSDPRTWYSGSFILKQTIQLPSEAGKYNLSLYLPDPEPTLKDNSRFAIQLANKGVWDEKTGFNNLKTLTVE